MSAHQREQLRGFVILLIFIGLILLALYAATQARTAVG